MRLQTLCGDMQDAAALQLQPAQDCHQMQIWVAGGRQVPPSPSFSAMPARGRGRCRSRCRGGRWQHFVLSPSGSSGCFLAQEGVQFWGKSAFEPFLFSFRAGRQDEVTLPVGLGDSLSGEHGRDSRLSPGPAMGGGCGYIRSPGRRFSELTGHPRLREHQKNSDQPHFLLLRCWPFSV